MKSSDEKQKIAVFQQKDRGESKVKGIERFGNNMFDLSIISIDDALPIVIDDTSLYLPKEIDADLVLDFLLHPDLSHDLAVMCQAKNIPIIASGKKIDMEHAITPPTWCTLPRQDGLGKYGEMFGMPEFEVDIQDDKVKAVRVLRGAPCGATWDAANRMIGLSTKEALRRIGLDTQFFCTANPANWDPIYQKSPVHIAGKVHHKALKNAMDI